MDEARLERGDILLYERCPFALPSGDDLAFLFTQRLGRFSHKNISYHPDNGHVTGQVRQGPAETNRLRDILAAFSSSVSGWLRETFGRYRSGIALDRASFRSEEEATRCVRHTARNDLLHLDAFSNRPSHGRRIMRVFVNVNPTDSRVWMTSEKFAKLLERFGVQAGLPRNGGLFEEISACMHRLFHAGHPARSDYDSFMLRFHNYLKCDDTFQEKGSKKLWYFPPGSAWAAMTDACTYAELRGRFALEHSFFIDTSVLAVPDESPAALLARACGRPLIPAKQAA